MRNRTWSDLVLATMIGLCFATAAQQQGGQPSPAQLSAAAESMAAPELGDAAQSLAVAMLLGSGSANSQPQHGDSERTPVLAVESAADRAMTKAAHAAGSVAGDIEMPFFSFGGDASAE